MRMKIFGSIITALVISGCGSSSDQEIKEANYYSLFPAYVKMCESNPDDMFCNNQPITGNELGYDYLDKTLSELYSNYTPMIDIEQYGEDDYWKHNDTVSEPLIGDCEDFSMTFVSQLILDGWSPDKISLIHQEGSGTAHLYVKIYMNDGTEYNITRNDMTDLYYMKTNEMKKIIKITK